MYDFQNNHLTIFKKGQYSNDIRSAHVDILCIGGISRVFQIVWGAKFCWGNFFYWVVGIWEGMILTIWTFLKLKVTFCEYWTLIKIKISITCMYKEYEVKMKMVEKQWLQLKAKFLLGYNMKTFIKWGN